MTLLTFDAVQEFHKYKREYLRARGATKSTGSIKVAGGHPLMVPGQLIPKTTWGDVTAFSVRYIAATSNSAIRSCINEYGSGWDTVASIAMCGTTFVETPMFNSALSNWIKWNPVMRIIDEFGYSYGGNLVLKQRVQAKEIYPYNEEFWGYGARYAIARSAAGVVRSRSEIMSESISEAAKELPETLKRAAAAVVPNIPFPIPSLGSLATMMKWGTIAGGAYLLYWLVKNK